MLGLLNPWVILGAFLTLLATAGGGFYEGYRWADQSAALSAAKRTTKELESVIEAKKQEAAAAQTVAQQATRRELETERMVQQLSTDIAAYEEQLTNRPPPDPVNGKCDPSDRLDDVDLRMYNSIARRGRGEVKLPGTPFYLRDPGTLAGPAKGPVRQELCGASACGSSEGKQAP